MSLVRDVNGVSVVGLSVCESVFKTLSEPIEFKRQVKFIISVVSLSTNKKPISKPAGMVKFVFRLLIIAISFFSPRSLQ